MEQIKRANKLFSNDCIFLRNSLNIPVLSEKRSIFNGLSLESPDGDGETACQDARTPHVMTQDIDGPSPPSSPTPQPQPQPEELSAKDFLHRLDLQIKQSKQAAQRLKEEEVRNHQSVCSSLELIFRGLRFVLLKEESQTGMQSVFALGWCGNNGVSLCLLKHTEAKAELKAQLFVAQQNLV
ncbi:hypothetical protein XENOCAPTIV_004746 [Xenoophorus captivus]|uniref:LysM and peptidoglycan-binding domain-containing protein 2 n=1 Tax=Xenoophorus captivus TaxID=1517983 RepID=A0ABV0RFI9_9TELE